MWWWNIIIIGYDKFNDKSSHLKDDSVPSLFETALSNFENVHVIFKIFRGNIEKIEKLLVQSGIQTRFYILYDTKRRIASYALTRISVYHKR